MKKLLLILFTLILGISVSAKNKSERYMQAYKKYENAKGPIKDKSIKNFVYFSHDREGIHNHPFLKNSNFQGAQIMYSWKQLETSKDIYDFSIIEEDLQYLKSHGKKLFIQLQDKTFSTKRKAYPSYLEKPFYDNGGMYQRGDDGQPEGWAAKRWNPEVKKRFNKLLIALGKEFDGRIEGVNLQETAIGVSNKYDKTFTSKEYVQSIKDNMLALKKAFPKSVTMQYANFIPGEWLPWNDYGYLRSIYSYGEKIGVGIGGPDLMVTKKGQLNHTIAMMHEHSYTVPLGIAIQDGNYIGQTNSMKIQKKRKNIVPMLHAFAKDFMKVNYIFWVNQKPYFKEDVLPSFSEK